MKTCTYHITFLEPVLVAGLEGDPNSAVSYDFIPGSVMRGALIARWQRASHVNTLPMDDTIRRLFFDGTVRYLNAYLVDRLGKRSLPMPQSWHHAKDDDKSIYDFALDGPDDENKDWKTEGGQFCTVNMHDEQFIRLSPLRQVTVHTAREPNKGRPDEGEGAVFRYVALAERQTFAGAIVCDDDALADKLKPLLHGELRLGRSRTAGYGRAQVAEVKEHGEAWQEAESVAATFAGGELVVTLLSDVMLRSTQGEFVVDAAEFARVLSARLNTSLTSVDGKVFVRARRVGAFNRTWGMPLPQALVAQMGSVLVFKADAIDAHRLRAVLTQGIGERRVDGFGRIAIDWQRAETLSLDETKPEWTEVVSIKDATSHQIATQMVERILRARLDDAVTARAREVGAQIRGVHKSQLSRLRLVIQDAIQQEPTEGRKRLRDYLNNLDKRQTTRKQFMRAKAAGKTLLEWLRVRVDDTGDKTGNKDETIWSDSGLNVVDQKDFPKIGNVAATLTPQLAYEYNLRLMDAVLERAAKAAREGKDQ